MPDIETRNSLMQLLQQLPIRQRTALVLRFYEDLSEHQTADMMGVSLRAVNSLVSRGLGELRRIEGGEEG
jgi:RNA polymerase sigma factor (sigma-70 family)